MALIPDIVTFKRLPEDIKPGDSITATAQVALNRTVNMLVRGVRPPEQVRPTSSGGVGGAIVACTITAIHRNHLTCTQAGGGSIEVARPLAARAPASELVLSVTWNYSNYSADYQYRTAVHSQNGSITERQVVLREYKIGDSIRATKVHGGTGIVEATDWEEVHSDRTWYRDAVTP